MDDERQFGREVTAARERMGLGQREAAALAGISTSTLNAMERGKGHPRPATRRRVAEALGMVTAAPQPGVDDPRAQAAATVVRSWVERLPEGERPAALDALMRVMVAWKSEVSCGIAPQASVARRCGETASHAVGQPYGERGNPLRGR